MQCGKPQLRAKSEAFLPKERIRSMPKKSTEQTETLSFRTGARYLAKLETRAARDGISIHKQAQKVLEATLDERDDELQLMRVQLSEVQEEMEAMREGMKLTLTGIVQGISKLTGENLSLEDANQFIENAFRQTGRGAANVIN